VRDLAARGDVRRAYDLTERALPLLDTLPPTNRRALLRSQLLLERGRLQWHGALLGTPFTFQEALTSLEAAKSSLPQDAPPEVGGQLAAALAGICYDLGDLPALQRALEVLTEQSRHLMNTGEPLLATRLLNDQAAVYIRLGDPVRASHLLAQSRQLFEHRLRNTPNDVMAAEELAETDHLLARLPLHVQARAGRQDDAYAIGLDHARAAEHAYQRLSQPHKLARVWETIGRLELQRGQLQAAQQRLTTALEVQRQLGDATGLARSAAALADLCVQTGRLGDAIALLSDSITLNFEKGSPLGLAFNRRTLGLLGNAATQTHHPGVENLHAALAEIETRLTQAESVLGRVVLPGEVD
jgi:tetratricopeptide (TPR) repeat protein